MWPGFASFGYPQGIRRASLHDVSPDLTQGIKATSELLRGAHRQPCRRSYRALHHQDSPTSSTCRHTPALQLHGRSWGALHLLGTDVSIFLRAKLDGTELSRATELDVPDGVLRVEQGDIRSAIAIIISRYGYQG
jgi:hypothetical protein